MKVKVEVEVPIDVEGDRIIIKSLDALTRILGTSAAASSINVLGVKKLGHQLWSMSIADFKKRIASLEEKKDDLGQKLNFMYQILNTIEPTDDLFGDLEDMEDQPTPLQTSKPMYVEKSDGRGRKKGEKIVAWNIHEHNLIQENLDKLDIMSIRELAEHLAPAMPERSKTAIELRIGKQKRGKAKKPKNKIMAQSPKILTEKPTFSKQKRTKKTWTYEEYMLIKNNLDKVQEYGTVYAFAKALMPHLPGRTQKSISGQVMKMVRGQAKQPSPSLSSSPLMPPKKIKETKTKFVTVKPSGKNKRWTPDEVKLLLDNWDKPNQELKKLLPYKRSSQSIFTKKWELKTKGLAPVKAEHHYMQRNKPLPIVSKDDGIKMLGDMTTRQTGFPGFSMIPHQSERYLTELVKDCLMRKGKIQYSDVRWIQSISRWNGGLWNEFCTEFIMNAPRIAKFYGIPNKFAIEKRGNEKVIVYKGGVNQ